MLKENLEETQKIASDVLSKTPSGTQETTYQDALTQPHAVSSGTKGDPRMMVREEIKKRQVLIREVRVADSEVILTSILRRFSISKSTKNRRSTLTGQILISILNTPWPSGVK
jgi:hypothetical protein